MLARLALTTTHRVAARTPQIARQPHRTLHSTAPTLHGSFEKQAAKSPEDVVNITIIDRQGERHAIAAKVGDNLMYLAHAHQVRSSGARTPHKQYSARACPLLRLV
jgi:hypothetical protein